MGLDTLRIRIISTREGLGMPDCEVTIPKLVLRRGIDVDLSYGASAPDRMLVTVAAEDIANAEKYYAGNCPIGRAVCHRIAETMPGTEKEFLWVENEAGTLDPRLWVPASFGAKDKPEEHRGCAIWGDMKGPLLCVLPPDVMDFLDDFDHDRQVLPGLRFEIPISIREYFVLRAQFIASCRRRERRSAKRPAGRKGKSPSRRLT